MTHREGAGRPHWAWLLAITAGLIVAGLWFALGLTTRTGTTLAVSVAAAAVAWALLRLRSDRAAHRADVTRWAASEAVLAERLRIARDLHDVVSHGLGMITVRAATAKHLHSQDPSEHALVEALDDIEEASRAATAELRRTLQALRADDEAPPRGPVDRVEALPGIIADAEPAGLTVELHQPDLGSLPAAVEMTICAVVREGLANAVRHAGPTRAVVALADGGDAVTVTVTDSGPTTARQRSPGAGHGLLGLQERVASVGGALEAAPHPPGYRLHARLPKKDA